jgi:CBS domain-containing protein
LLRTGKQCFLVRNGQGVEGIITPYEVKETDRSRWPYTTVGQAMQPLDKLRAITPDTPVREAMEIMSREDVNELPVMRDGRIEGFITRGGVLRLLQTRAALDM